MTDIFTWQSKDMILENNNGEPFAIIDPKLGYSSFVILSSNGTYSVENGEDVILRIRAKRLFEHFHNNSDDTNSVFVNALKFNFTVDIYGMITVNDTSAHGVYYTSTGGDIKFVNNIATGAVSGLFIDGITFINNSAMVAGGASVVIVWKHVQLKLYLMDVNLIIVMVNYQVVVYLHIILYLMVLIVY